jgi:hypothetical protein
MLYNFFMLRSTGLCAAEDCVLCFKKLELFDQKLLT